MRALVGYARCDTCQRRRRMVYYVDCFETMRCPACHTRGMTLEGLQIPVEQLPVAAYHLAVDDHQLTEWEQATKRRES